MLDEQNLCGKMSRIPSDTVATQQEDRGKMSEEETGKTVTGPQEKSESRGIKVLLDEAMLRINRLETDKDTIESMDPQERADELTRTKARVFDLERKVRRAAKLIAAMRGVQKLPRNSPCLCGSGKKIKHCCLHLASAWKEEARRLMEHPDED